MINPIKSQIHNRNILDTQALRLADYIEKTDLRPFSLPEEYFYASLPLCVIDTVFSINVKYICAQNAVTRYCKYQDWTKFQKPRVKGGHSISEFLTSLEGRSPEQLATDLFGNRQRTSSSSGILKAEAVQLFATALVKARIDDFSDINENRLISAKTDILKITGQSSGISFDYFRMLAGDDTLIKPDRMVQRYIEKALGVAPKEVDANKSRILLRGATQLLVERKYDWSPRRLDYAIWKRERGDESPTSAPSCRA